MKTKFDRLNEAILSVDMPLESHKVLAGRLLPAKAEHAALVAVAEAAGRLKCPASGNNNHDLQCIRCWCYGMVAGQLDSLARVREDKQDGCRFTYNTSISLWAAYASSNPSVALYVRDGHVAVNATEILARFNDDQHAAETLKAAGYFEYGIGCFKAKAKTTPYKGGKEVAS